MLIKEVIDEDFVNYKKCSMFIIFPSCNWKCGKEYCQNSPLALAKNIEISAKELVDRFQKNPLSKAVVCGGLEPLDTFEDLIEFISLLRVIDDESPVIVYTGYNEDEVKTKIEILSTYKNIIVKFGRFIPNDVPHRDEVLGIDLVSSNQYAKRLEYTGD